MLSIRRPLRTSALHHMTAPLVAWPAAAAQLCSCPSRLDLVPVKTACAHTSPTDPSHRTRTLAYLRDQSLPVCATPHVVSIQSKLYHAAVSTFAKTILKCTANGASIVKNAVVISTFSFKTLCSCGFDRLANISRWQADVCDRCWAEISGSVGSCRAVISLMGTRGTA